MMKHKIKVKEFEQIVDDYQDSMFSFAFFRTGSYASAQDAVQDVLIKLYDRTTQFIGEHREKQIPICHGQIEKGL
jgi:DNA-directed RNA polymerase specialized sigma24 family protein